MRTSTRQFIYLWASVSNPEFSETLGQAGEGVKNINHVNDKLKAATSWHSIYDTEPALVGAEASRKDVAGVLARWVGRA
jgi:hypothetical protein